MYVPVRTGGGGLSGAMGGLAECALSYAQSCCAETPVACEAAADLRRISRFPPKKCAMHSRCGAIHLQAWWKHAVLNLQDSVAIAKEIGVPRAFVEGDAAKWAAALGIAAAA